jgi:uncharacterized protein (DUF885 family)
MDHYLAKELTMSLLDSPEFMTYVGIFDKYNAFLKHNQKLSIRTLDDGDADYQDSLDHLSMLQSYDPSKLSDIQKVTQKIAIFDTENNINEFKNFRYHSYPFNQIGGNHLGLVEFMTDTHPVRDYREASDYIKRVEKFDDSLSEDLIWLEEQKKLGIFAPKYVFDHVIAQLNDLIAYEDSDNPLMQVFMRKVDALEIDQGQSDELKAALSSVIASEVKAGFQSILDFFEANYEYANKDHGFGRCPMEMHIMQLD